jgi:aminoglycoside phosphotransferase (APT) family kinase protein
MKMHADEVDVDVDLVARLIASQFREWASLSIEPVAFFGTDNAIYRLGDDKAARLPRREQNVATLQKERRWLPKLAPLLPLSIPLPLVVGKPEHGYPFEWSIYRWLDGEPATVAPIADVGQAAHDLASFIAALQQVETTDAPPPGSHNVGRGQPLARRDKATRAAIDALGDAIDANAVTSVWETALAAPIYDGPPVWLHGDLDARNILVENGRITGVIDFGCLGPGDPAADVMVAWKMFPPETRRLFRNLLSVDDATWSRARGWVLSQALIALPYYTMETNPVLVTEAKRWLAAVLDDYRASE